ncbi:hypothetical protein [Thermococcus sp. 4557]|uniref:hypothetical protein n=1 Tax=Thermococcus sp. (strain CGMCC 1.5172 / 4557) TaxID=1042877 RepID=UPI00130544BD|nr:hypothetical protein [Thermococcus sp. 4557]
MMKMENLNEPGKQPMQTEAKKLERLRHFRGALGTFEEKTIKWAIAEAEEL